MRNEQLEIAQEFLKRHNVDRPDWVVIDLIERIVRAAPDVYETGDFVQVNFGMGEAGFGTIEGPCRGGYHLTVWTPEPNESPVMQRISASDIRGLSNPEKTLEYHKVRSA